MKEVQMTTKKKTKRTTKKATLPTGIGPHETVQPFNEQFKFPGGGKSITFDAESYTAWLHTVLPVMKDLTPCSGLTMEVIEENGVPVGDYLLYAREMPLWYWGSYWGGIGFATLPSENQYAKRLTLQIYRGTTSAYIGFSAPVVIPVLCEKRYGLPEVWMSLTPNEILTLRGQVRRARGIVGVAGLGLGWVVRRILERSTVKKLTVVELNPAVIEMFGTPLLREFGDRLQIVNENAYAHDWHQYDVSLWDIWPGYGDADFDNLFTEIRNSLRKVGKVCVGWGDKLHGVS